MIRGEVGLFSKSIFIGLVTISTSLGQDKGMNHYENQEFEAAQQEIVGGEEE